MKNGPDRLRTPTSILRVPSLGDISCGNEHFPGSKNNYYPAEVLACFVVLNQYVL